MALPPAVEKFVAAMRAASADLLAASYVPDGVLEEVGFGAVYTGQDAIREDEAVFLDAFSNVVIEVSNVFAAGDWAAAEFEFTGVYSGQLPEVPAGAGQTVTLRGSSILHFSDAGILRHNQYFDALGFLVAIGAMPAP